MTMEPAKLTVRTSVHFTPARRGRKQMVVGEAPLPAPIPAGRVPRISRLMALAIRFEDLLRRGEVRDYAELARIGHVTRARVTQIMNLLNLAPDIQEEILVLPPVEAGRDPVKEWEVRSVAAEVAWAKQRLRWRATARRGQPSGGRAGCREVALTLANRCRPATVDTLRANHP